MDLECKKIIITAKWIKWHITSNPKTYIIMKNESIKCLDKQENVSKIMN